MYWADPSGTNSIEYNWGSGMYNVLGDNGNVLGIIDPGSFNLTEYLNNPDKYINRILYSMDANFDESGSDDGGGNGNGGGKNKGANSRGVGRNYSQMGLLGMSGYTFFGAPIRLIPYDFGASSYFGGAINVYVGTWKEYLKKGLDSYIGRHLMHEYGHYLQEKYAGMLSYYTEVVPSSLESFQGDYHDRNWAEIQASTLAYLYFNKPNRFKNENIVNYNTISPYAPASMDYGIMNSIYGQYINHPDYKP